MAVIPVSSPSRLDLLATAFSRAAENAARADRLFLDDLASG